jgi:hypothetical protein
VAKLGEEDGDTGTREEETAATDMAAHETVWFLCDAFKK